MRHLLLLLVVLEPASAARNPLSLAQPVDARFEGVVEERLDAGSYQYLRVRDDDGASRWVATLRRASSSPTTGRVSVHVFARADRFESKRVAHVFTPLSFGSVTPTPESK